MPLTGSDDRRRISWTAGNRKEQYFSIKKVSVKCQDQSLRPEEKKHVFLEGMTAVEVEFSV